MKPLKVKRSNVTLMPDRTHVLARPFHLISIDRSVKIYKRVMELPEETVIEMLASLRTEFSDRQRRINEFLLRRYEEMSGLFPADAVLSLERKLLLGGYFTHEYSLEAAALFNPSMVPHFDQTGVPEGSLRFILSLRATAEGHISSIVFRTGVVDGKGKITDANLIIPTGQNLNNIECDMHALVPQILDKSEDEIRLTLEMLVRAYDPCISCATHLLDVEFIR